MTPVQTYSKIIEPNKISVSCIEGIFKGCILLHVTKKEQKHEHQVASDFRTALFKAHLLEILVKITPPPLQPIGDLIPAT